VHSQPCVDTGSHTRPDATLNVQQLLRYCSRKSIHNDAAVPPAMNALCQAAEAGQFPRVHQVRWVKSGAAPLAPDLPRRFTSLTGILVCQGYGMTEASPVTHVGFSHRNLLPGFDRPSLDTNRLSRNRQSNPETGAKAQPRPAANEPGELSCVARSHAGLLERTRGLRLPCCATAGTGPVTSSLRGAEGFFRVVDRRKEMIKYKGFPVAPAEVEAVLLEHRPFASAERGGGRMPAPEKSPSIHCSARWFCDREEAGRRTLCLRGRAAGAYKQPREVHFVDGAPRQPPGRFCAANSGKRSADIPRKVHLRDREVTSF